MKVGLVFGGPSGEHAISLISAAAIARGLRKGGHEVLELAIDRDCRWCPVDESSRILEGVGKRPDMAPDFSGTMPLAGEVLKQEVDIVFPALHGPFGEDGVIQGLLEALGLPYVGCGVEASALCMDKIRSKDLVAHAGIATAEFFSIRKGDDSVVGEQADFLGYPLFVKPARMGSSVGISRVSDPRELHQAVEEAFRWDREVLVERALDVREIEVAILGNREPRASVPGEIRSDGGFYDFAGKYINDSAGLLAPAPLDPAEAERLRRKSLEIFSLLGCEGMARVDLFLEEDGGEIYFNEVNTIPGFTPISMYPRLWELSGLSFPDLLDELLKLGLEAAEWRRIPAGSAGRK